MLLLPENLTLVEARNVMAMLEHALRRDADAGVVVDASGLRHFDSSALAVLLECARLAGAFGKAFSLRAMPAKLEQLATLYGVETLLPKEPAAV